MIFIKLTDKGTKENFSVNIKQIEKYQDYYVRVTSGLWHQVEETESQIDEKIRIAKKRDREDFLCALADIKECLKYLR